MTGRFVFAQRRDEIILAAAAVQAPYLPSFGCEQYCMLYIPPDGTCFASAELSMLFRGAPLTLT